MSAEKPVTPTSLREEADRDEATAKALIESARKRRNLAAQLEQLESGLSRDRDSVTIETMSATTIVSPTTKRRPGVRPKAKGPVGTVATILGISVVDLAKKIDENYESMRTWNVRGKVPDDVAKKLNDLVDEHKKAAKKSK